MSELSDEEEKMAKAVLSEKNQLCRMLHDSIITEEAKKESRKSSQSTYDSIFLLRRGNDILRGEILELQTQLENCAVSAAETVFKFQRLREKRANLRNENQGLRNIMAHQTPKVQEANRFLAGQLTIKRLSDEKNCAAKEEIKRLKETREREMEQFYAASRREAYLKEQLACVSFPPQLRDSQALKTAIASKDRTIQRLEADIERARITKGNPQIFNKSGDEADMAKLRAEYDSLSERLQMLAE